MPWDICTERSYHDDDLRVWPDPMDPLDKTLVVLDIGGRRDVVGHVGIVSAEIYDHEVSGLLLAKVPRLGLVLSW